MTIKELLNTVDVNIAADGEHLEVRVPRDLLSAKRNECCEYIKANKPAIMDYLRDEAAAKKAALDDYTANLNGIDGLKDLQNSIISWSDYNRAFSRYIANDCIGTAPVKPNVTVEELEAQYPRAAAYVMADKWHSSDNDVKSTLGGKAKDQILNGADHTAVIADMQRAWSDYCNDHID